MQPLMQPELVEIGHSNPGRWSHIAEVYAELGMLPREHSLEGLVFDPHPQPDLKWAYRGLAAALAAVLAIGAFAWYQRRQLAQIRALKAQLEEQAIRDPLTGLYNRRYLDDALERELVRAQREGYPVSVAMLDLDRFKALNDAHGHPAGDAVLVALSKSLREQVRAGDLACRWGGEEFLLLLPNMPLAAAATRVDKLRARFGASSVTAGRQEGVGDALGRGRRVPGAWRLAHRADRHGRRGALSREARRPRPRLRRAGSDRRRRAQGLTAGVSSFIPRARHIR